jgi:hypothetical protein
MVKYSVRCRWLLSKLRNQIEGCGFQASRMARVSAFRYLKLKLNAGLSEIAWHLVPSQPLPFRFSWEWNYYILLLLMVSSLNGAQFLPRSIPDPCIFSQRGL